jgi:hypothetical protein
VEVGRELLHVKEKLPHGHFGPWLEAEFGWSQRTAQQLMSVAREFGDREINLANVAPSAIQLLAAPSVPEEAREEAAELANQGEPISHAKAHTIIQEVVCTGSKSADSARLIHVRVYPTLTQQQVANVDEAKPTPIGELKQMRIRVYTHDQAVEQLKAKFLRLNEEGRREFQTWLADNYPLTPDEED